MKLYDRLCYLYNHYFTSYKESSWRDTEISERIHRDKQGLYY